MTDLSNVHRKVEHLKALSALSGYRSHPGVKKAAELAISSRNPKWSERLERFLGSQIAMPLDDIHPFLPGPDPSDVGNGEIVLGSLPEAGGTVRLPISHLAQGLCIFGTTGSGKTWLLASICKQLVRHGIKVWVFDREGEFQNYLAEEIRQRQALALGYKALKRNLLEAAPGEEPKEAINRITSIWRGSQYLRDGSVNMLSKILHGLFEEHGVFHGKTSFPSIFDLQEALSGMTFKGYERDSQYHVSLTNRTDSLVDNMGDVYRCSRGFDIRELLNHSIVWNLMGLSTFLHQFFVEDLMSYAIAYKERQGISTISNVFVIDEAHRLLASNEDRSDLGEPFIFQVARTTRKRGFGLVIADQVPSQVPSSIIGNMNTRIVMKLINGPCIRRLGASMSLNDEQMGLIPMLPMRTAIIHSLVYATPFLVQVPELSYGDRPSREEVDRMSRDAVSKFAHAASATTAPAVPTDAKDKDSSHHEAAREIETASQGPTHENQAPQDGPITKDELDYLMAIGKDPFLPVTELDTRIGMSLWKGNSLRKKLEARGYIQLYEINTGRKGRPIVVPEITREGYEMLDGMKAGIRRPRGIGGFRHRFWQHQIQRWYQEKFKNCQVVIEDTSGPNGKAVDVGVQIGAKKTAVEIMMAGEGKETSNVLKDLKGYDLVICCCEDWETLSNLRQKVKEAIGEEKRVWFKLLREFAEVAASPSADASGSAKNKAENA